MHQIEPIGIIHSPHTTIENMPIQPKGAADCTGQIIVQERYIDGLQDLEGFSHLYLLYDFHQAQRTEMKVTPFMDTTSRGVFATRSPLRPNHIGLSVVQLVRREGACLFVQGIDVLDGTPLLDIKPYIEKFDSVTHSRSGWMDATDDQISKIRSDGRFR